MISTVRIEDYAALAFRPFLKSRVSKKRVNQHFFESLCDASIRTSNDLKKSLPSEIQSVYVRSDLLDNQLIGTLPETVKVLVSGNSDRDFIKPLSFPTSIDRVYLQNLCFSSDLVRVLPIGVENLALAKAGLPHLYLSRGKPKLRGILVGPFGMTHPERKELLEVASKENGNITRIEKRITAWEYSILSQRHEFVACPRGNGIDTHRLWECLYRGSIPVVKRSVWSEMIEMLDLPIVQVESWDEILRLDLEKEYSKHSHNPRLALSPEYWKSLVGI